MRAQHGVTGFSVPGHIGMSGNDQSDPAGRQRFVCSNHLVCYMTGNFRHSVIGGGTHHAIGNHHTADINGFKKNRHTPSRLSAIEYFILKIEYLRKLVACFIMFKHQNSGAERLQQIVNNPYSIFNSAPSFPRIPLPPLYWKGQ